MNTTLNISLQDFGCMKLYIQAFIRPGVICNEDVGDNLISQYVIRISKL